MTDRAVNEVIAFILLFGIILTVSFGGAFFGIQAIQDMTEGQDLQTAKSSMAGYRGHAYDIAAGGAPYRSTAIEIADGTLEYGKNITVTVEASDSDETLSVTMSPRTLIYDVGRNQVVFAAGAVFVQQEGGAAMLKTPVTRIDTNQSIFPLVNTSYRGGPTSVGITGHGQAYIVSYRWSATTESLRFNDSSGTIVGTGTITVESPRASAWARWFDDDPRYDNVSPVSDTDGDGMPEVSAEFSTERVYVRTTDIHVKYDV